MYDARFDGEEGDCGAGSEKIFAPGDGRESHGGVLPMTLGIVDESLTALEWEHQGLLLGVRRQQFES
jgi:hypothetical protein